MYPLRSGELKVWKAEADTDVPNDDVCVSEEEEPPGSRSPRRRAQPREATTLTPAVMDAWVSTLPASQESDGSQTALFLDYDGTLREFEARPDQATPTPDLLDLLERLNRCEGLLVHIISGRDAKFMYKHFGKYNHMVLIAEHQRLLVRRFQVWGAGSLDRHEQVWRSIVQNVFSQGIAELPGSEIEEKPSALVWHYRAVADDGLASELALKMMVQLSQLQEEHGLQVTRGHKTMEVSKRSMSKGDVMKGIIASRKEEGKPFGAVLIAGDGLADESMFEAAEPEFLTIKVGRDSTRAAYCVESPAELRMRLWQLVPAEAASGSS